MILIVIRIDNSVYSILQRNDIEIDKKTYLLI